MTWMPEASDQVTEETVGHEEVPLTPAQVGILKKNFTLIPLELLCGLWCSIYDSYKVQRFRVRHGLSCVIGPVQCGR